VYLTSSSWQWQDKTFSLMQSWSVWWQVSPISTIRTTIRWSRR